ncbi:hypothetical protein HC766_01100 [Candidatus Gracilibacteria bacterium]|nr:hypothetical protein [Thermales bacterium]NJS40975.1 hypothetical protein [Candidatus Gracilibacteria bacterium]
MNTPHIFQWYAQQYPESAITTVFAAILGVVLTIFLTKSADQVIKFIVGLFGAKKIVKNEELVRQIVTAINDSKDKNSLGYKVEKIQNQLIEMNDPEHSGSLANQIKGTNEAIQFITDSHKPGSLAFQMNQGFKRIEGIINNFQITLKDHESRINTNEVVIEERLPRQPLV